MADSINVSLASYQDDNVTSGNINAPNIIYLHKIIPGQNLNQAIPIKVHTDSDIILSCNLLLEHIAMDKDTSLQILVPIALAADCKTAYLGNSNYYIPNDQAYSGSYAGALGVCPKSNF